MLSDLGFSASDLDLVSWTWTFRLGSRFWILKVSRTRLDGWFSLGIGFLTDLVGFSLRFLDRNQG